MIKAENISFSYRGKSIFSDVSLDIAPEQTTVLIGPSGSGKTTLIKNLTLLEAPTSGIINIEGTEYKFPATEDNPLPPAPYPHVTVAFQQQFLWPHLTLRENIMLPTQNIDASARHFDLAQLIELFDMAEFIDHYPNEASLGQRQRISLARALMLNPKYLFLDEITTFLDVKQVHKILQCIQTLKKEGIAVFLITHLLGFAKDIADQIIFFDQGRIIEQGGTALLEKPNTPELQEFLSFHRRLH